MASAVSAKPKTGLVVNIRRWQVRACARRGGDRERGRKRERERNPLLQKTKTNLAHHSNHVFFSYFLSLHLQRTTTTTTTTSDAAPPRYPRVTLSLPLSHAQRSNLNTTQAVGVWTWNAGDKDDVCGICHMPLDGCAPGAAGPGDDSPVVWGRVRACRPFTLCQRSEKS